MKTEELLTKKDKFEIIGRIISFQTDLQTSIYTAGVIQLLAIIGSVLAILSFMHK